MTLALDVLMCGLAGAAGVFAVCMALIGAFITWCGMIGWLRK